MLLVAVAQRDTGCLLLFLLCRVEKGGDSMRPFSFDTFSQKRTVARYSNVILFVSLVLFVCLFVLLVLQS